MKLEIGMYVRLINNDGILGKIITITNSNNNFVEIQFQNIKMEIPTFFIKKASHNIIDLIEYWDLLYVDISPDDCGGIVIPMVLSTSAELDSFKKNIKNGRYILKGIVTKKILESYCYMIGD